MLTPEEIQAREFLVSLRGYDRDEVHRFLEEVARYIGDLHSQLGISQAEQPRIQPSGEGREVDPAQVPHSAADSKPFFDDLAQTTQRIVEAAYESAAEIQRRARSRADRELAEARSQAAKLVAEGQRRREVIEGLVGMLEERRAVLAEDLRGIARIVEQMLNDFAPQGELPTLDELLAAAPVTESGGRWASEDDDRDEVELAAAQPDAGEAELAEVSSDRDSGDSPAEATPQAAQKARLA